MCGDVEANSWEEAQSKTNQTVIGLKVGEQDASDLLINNLIQCQ